MEYYAHTSTEKEWQLLSVHLENVAKMCRDFDFEHGDYMYTLGLLHDLGKYQAAFQRRLAGSNARVDHSTLGAKYVFSPSCVQSQLMAYCIAGHHGGLPDGGTDANLDDATLLARLKNEHEDISDGMKELTIPIINDSDMQRASQLMGLTAMSTAKRCEKIYNYLSFKTRFMYSALVDADYLDTEKFCNNVERETDFDSLQTLLDKLDAKLSSFEEVSKIDIARNNFRKQAVENLKDKPSIISLNVPTGAGKTLLSMKLALEMCVREGKKRVIYVIPYTSIIEQNAKVFKDIFGNKNVLEHHSNYEYSTEDNENVLKQCSENWNSPIIVTTNVQFFESIYSNRSSRMRKLHNMCDAVICFDEAHVIPLKLFDACMNAMGYLNKFCNSNLILMSGTMVDYKKLHADFANIVDVVPDKSMYEVFERAKLIDRTNEDLREIIKTLNFTRSNLLVVNTKNTAKKLFEAIAFERKYMLTTLHTPKDRRKIIEEIRGMLKLGIPIIVVSTSLIEAGVDLDFDFVYREINGLDNILQCMGRCNREGKKADCATYIFETENTKKMRNQDVKLKIALTEDRIRESNVLTKQETIDKYNEALYYLNKETLATYDFAKINGGTTKCGVMKNGIFSLPFASYAKLFKYIDDDTKDIVIVNDETKPLLDNLDKVDNVKIRRTLANNSVSVYSYDLDKLKKKNAVGSIKETFYLLSPSLYSKETGLKTDTNDETDLLIL